MAEEKIRIPASQGGLTRYFDEYKSKIQFSPGQIIIISLILMVLIILLHYLGRNLV